LPAPITIRRLTVNRESERAIWHAIGELCCRTGNNGEPIAPERWQLFAKIWIEPYEKQLPDWTYVVEADGEVIGYLTGCPDSKKFTRRNVWRSTVPLLADILFGRFRGQADARAFARRAFGLTPSVERCFPSHVRRRILSAYPAHLHINVDARWRGGGVGRRLCQAFFADLRAQGIAGVHLYCGADPLKFYIRLGFDELSTMRLGAASVHLLGIKIPT
jgi:GNAT superfamily N-acetyltransferase